MNCLHLASGNIIPNIGLGVYRSAVGAETYNAVYNGLKLGYRHFDTAQIYRNEADVGDAIYQFLQEETNITRSDIFITTKLWLNNFGYDQANVQ